MAEADSCVLGPNVVASTRDEIEARAAQWHREHGVPQFRLEPGDVVGTVRRRYARYVADLNDLRPAPAAVREVIEENFLTRDGTQLPVRMYRPATEIDAVFVYLHGGGWTIGDLESHDHVCRQIAAVSGCTVVAVDYRLSPESRFPAALDDCVDAVRWTQRNVLGGDGSRLIVGGDSAGANLAACTAIHERDSKGARVDHQVLIYGAFDVAKSEDWWYRDNYLVDRAQRLSPYANPFHASATGLPPALVVVAGYDLLAPDSSALAAHFGRAGIDVEILAYKTMPHGFLDFAGVVTEASEAMAAIASRIAELARRPVTPTASPLR